MSTNIQDPNVAAYAKARVQTVVSMMGASGWNVHTANPELMVPSSIFFYVFDHVSRWCWMCSIPKPVFYEAADNLASIGLPECVSAVAGLVGSRDGMSSDWENQLGVALTGYITKTATYGQSNHGSSAPHFVVINYGKSKMVRPFAVPGGDRFVLPAQRVMELVRVVVSRDTITHPDWVDLRL
jgi:hypothetical protein